MGQDGIRDRTGGTQCTEDEGLVRRGMRNRVDGIGEGRDRRKMGDRKMGKVTGRGK